MSNKVVESFVVPAPLSTVWELVRELDLSKMIPSLVSTSNLTQGAADQVSSMRHVVFYDGTQWDLRLTELSDYAHLITYEIVSSVPAMEVSAVVNTIKLRPITVTKQCFVEWTTDFSRDCSPAILEDCRYKRRDMLTDLAKAVRIPAFKYPIPNSVEDLHKLPPPAYTQFIHDLDTTFHVCLPADFVELAATMNGFKAKYPAGINPAQWVLVCRQLGFPRALQGSDFFSFLDLNRDHLLSVEELTLRFYFNVGIDAEGVGSPALAKACFELLDLGKTKTISYAQLQDFAFFIVLRATIRAHKPVVLKTIADSVDAQLKQFMAQHQGKVSLKEFSNFWLE